MVAVIKVGKSIRRTFHYNENKLEEGVAELLMAQNYPVELEKLNTVQRLNMLLRTAESNPNIKANSVHISLNFAVNDNLDNEKLKKIAQDYMNAIGFGNQPYLVYKHNDAGHPHIHIATVKVDSNGKRIETQNIGRLLSEPARKAIEERYGLVKAENHVKEHFQLKPVEIKKVEYGKKPTKNAISNVLENVLNQYRYTSLHELNAILKLYNVKAQRGQKDSRTYKMKGLYYTLLKQDGSATGIPIKASLFYNRPTLKFLEKKFIRNAISKQDHKEKTKSTIAFVLKSKKPKSITELKNMLKREGVELVVRTGRDGVVFGVTYVDFRSKCVFNGSDLGKSFSAKGITETLNNNDSKNIAVHPDDDHKQLMKSHLRTQKSEQSTDKQNHDLTPEINSTAKDTGMIEQLLNPEYTSQHVPFEWKKRKRRKKKQ